MKLNCKRILFTLGLGSCSLMATLMGSTMAIAQDQTSGGKKVVWTAENSDPNTLGWMQGFPPPADKIIRFDDNSFAEFPQWRWSVCNFQLLMPT